MDLSQVTDLILVLVFVTSSLWTSVDSQSSNSVEFNLLEEQAADTFVGSVAKASGIEAEVPPSVVRNLRYHILSPDSVKISSILIVNNRTGELYTTAMVDREKVCDATVMTCRLEFDVAVKQEVTILRIIHVVVVIQDINDNAPAFPIKELRQNMSEASPKGSDFSVFSAVDKDEQDAAIIYWMEENPVFGLREEKLLGASLLKVVLLQDLDREKQNEYLLRIFAKDSNTSSALTGSMSVIITITDINDNGPEFVESLFNFNVSEDAVPGSWVGTVGARDQDIGDNGRVSFRFSSLTSSKVLQLFDLDPESGNVTVKSDLVYESGGVFQSVVVATDHGASPKASQAVMLINIIDIGNTPPRLSLNLVDSLTRDTTLLSEDLPMGGFIGTLSYQDNDKGDNGIVECASLNSHFGLEIIEKSGYAIVLTLPLDREAEDITTAVFKCFDHGTPSLFAFENFTVRVTDVNDNSPVFVGSKNSGSIKEGEPRKVNIIKVSANDPDEGVNSEVMYQLTMNTSNSFSIDPYSGWISLIAPVDRETEPIIRLNIEAVDRGIPSLTGSITVTIFVEDVNDNAPEIIKTEYQVKENAQAGTFISQIIAIDNDEGYNSELTFELVSDTSAPFRVSESGIISTAEILDREVTDRYTIVVLVKDKGIPQLTGNSTLTITVTDTNDHSPQIVYPTPGNDSIVVSANLPPGFVIAKVNARDADVDKNSKLLYLIAEGNPHQIFGIDNTSGVVYLSKRLTTSRNRHYRLTISVQDSGSPRLHNNTFLFVNVDFTNATVADATSDIEQKYVIIAGVIAGITLVIAATLIAIILKIRKSEPGRNPQFGMKSKNTNLVHAGTKIFSETGTLEVSTFKMDPAHKDERFDDEKEKGRDPNTSFDSSLTNGSIPASYRPSLTRELLDHQGRHRLTSEDINSDTSGEATTSDSGRGASDAEDMSSGASPPPPLHPGATAGIFPGPLVSPREISTQMTPINAHGNLTLTPENVAPRSGNTLVPRHDFHNMRKPPGKVRFFFDDQSPDNYKSLVSFNPLKDNGYQQLNRSTRPEFYNGQRTGISKQPDNQYIPNRASNLPKERGFPNVSKGPIGNVPLSMDALAKHNQLQEGSRYPKLTSNGLAVNLPTNNPPYQNHGLTGPVNKTVDEEDDNYSTTTSGSYIIDIMDDTINVSADC